MAIGIQRRIAERFGVAPERVELEHVGLNHLSWERAVRVDGVDRLPELLAGRDRRSLAEQVGLPGELLRGLGAIPSYYLRYYYRLDQVLERAARRRPHAGQEVIDIEAQLLEMYRDPALAEKPALLGDRGGAFYSEAAAQLIASLHDGAGDVQVVDVRNVGALPDLPDDAVVEIPARIDRDGAHPLPLAPLAPEMRGLVQAVEGYEKLAIEAALSGDRRVALRALLANPLVADYDVAAPLLDALLEANRALPAAVLPARAAARSRRSGRGPARGLRGPREPRRRRGRAHEHRPNGTGRGRSGRSNARRSPGRSRRRTRRPASLHPSWHACQTTTLAAGDVARDMSPARRRRPSDRPPAQVSRPVVRGGHDDMGLRIRRA